MNSKEQMNFTINDNCLTSYIKVIFKGRSNQNVKSATLLVSRSCPKFALKICKRDHRLCKNVNRKALVIRALSRKNKCVAHIQQYQTVTSNTNKISAKCFADLNAKNSAEKA